jgi:hypothetical protein
MAINVEYLMKKGLSTFDQFIMQLIFQNTSEDMSEELQINMNMETLTRLLALNLIMEVKAKNKKEHEFRKLRLSKKGKEIFKNSQIVDFTEHDENLYAALSDMYLKLDKQIGNDVKVKQMLAWFRTEAGYTRKMIYTAVRYFLGTHVDDKKEQYIPTLEHLLWKGGSVFSTKWSLADSRLYRFIQENKQALNGNRES